MQTKPDTAFVFPSRLQNPRQFAASVRNILLRHNRANRCTVTPGKPQSQVHLLTSSGSFSVIPVPLFLYDRISFPVKLFLGQLAAVLRIGIRDSGDSVHLGQFIIAVKV